MHAIHRPQNEIFSYLNGVKSENFAVKIKQKNQLIEICNKKKKISLKFMARMCSMECEEISNTCKHF